MTSPAPATSQDPHLVVLPRGPTCPTCRASVDEDRRSGRPVAVHRQAYQPNKQLKRAFFLSASAALRDPASRAYYDRKRAQDKKHNAALICLARRRVDVLHAMLKTGTLYEHRPARAA